MKPYVAVIAMVNGMIGGLILELPILADQGGTLLSFIIILVTGFFSFYSCYLCILHLGEHDDLDSALVHHFGGKKCVKIFYDFLVSINLIFLLLLYYQLIVQQWIQLVGNNIAIPICNGVVLVGLVVLLNYLHLGPELLGYGIISIIGYCIFLIWMLASAPSGNNTIPLFGSGAVNLAASMGQAFAIQTFFIPVLRQLPDTKLYPKFTLLAYIIGTLAYLYIAFMGSFGIVNRVPITPLETIQNYFPTGQWQVAILNVLYLIHLYSAFGEFLLVSKKRFFGIFNLKESKTKSLLNISEVIFTVGVVGLCAGIYFAGVSIGVLIEINGAIIGFFFIYLLPALMHAKCLYLPERFRKKDEALNEAIIDRKQSIEMGEISTQKTESPVLQNTADLQRHLSKLSKTTEKNNDNKSQNGEEDRQKDGEEDRQKDEQKNKVIDYTCKCTKPKPLLQVIDLISLIGMVGLGAFIMVDGFISVVEGNA